MKINSSLAGSIFFGLGERIAFLFVVIVFLSLFFIETTPVFSEEEEFYAGYTKNGLTYDYYLNSSYSNSVDLKVNISTLHSIEQEMSKFIYVDPSSNDIWEKISQCESRGNWAINTGNGYYGGLQFSQSAWHSVGGAGFAHEASKDEQIMRGKMLQERRGWGVWGLCAKRLGLS